MKGILDKMNSYMFRKLLIGLFADWQASGTKGNDFASFIKWLSDQETANDDKIKKEHDKNADNSQL